MEIRTFNKKLNLILFTNSKFAQITETINNYKKAQ